MSIFTVEISPSQVTSVEIETTVGQNPSNIDIITSSAVNLEITNSVALLPSDFNSNIDSRLFSVINAGSGIDIEYDINQPSITISSTGDYANKTHSHNPEDINNLSTFINNNISSTISGLQSQIDNKQPVGNYATLINGLIPPSQLPSYVDDILEYNNLSSFPISGESGKIYVSLDNSKVYRWGGTGYIEISASPGSSDSVPEGNTNKYYTDARASAAAPVQSVSGKTGAVTLNKNDVNLGNVDNTSDANKPISTAVQTALDSKQPAGNYAAATHNHAISEVSGLQTGLDSKAPLANPTFTGTVNGITKSMVGLGNVDNTSDTNKPVSTSQQSALDLKAPLASPTFTGTVNGITKSMVGLGNVDNISDINKPVSVPQASADAAVQANAAIDASTKANSAQAHSIQRANHTGTQDIATINGLQTALDNKAALAHGHNISDISNLQNTLDNKQPVGNYATLINGLVPAVQLPSYIDDVLEYLNLSTFPVVGETGKIYISLDNNKTYRWGGSSYIEITASPGSTDSIAEGGVNKYYTDARASAAAPVQSVAGKIGNISLVKNDVGLGNVDNTSDANKPVSTAQQSALDLKAPLANPTFTGTVAGITKSMVGLGSVDNTSDANKPISSATQTALDLKSSVGHNHTYSDISNFNTGVESIVSTSLIAGSNIVLTYNTSADTLSISTSGLQPAGNYANATHTHIIDNITGLQTALDNKQATGDYATNTDISNLQTQINNKQASGDYSLVGHQHISTDISDFENRVVSIVATGVPLEYLATSVLVHDDPIDITGDFSSITKEYVYIFKDSAVGYKLILPTAINNKAQYTLKNKTSDTIYLYPHSSQTIDGYDSIGLNRMDMSISVISDGSNWIMV
jgi:hypothetical protein